MVAELSDGTPGVRGCKRCGKQITLRRKRPHQTFCSKECVSKWWAEQDWQPAAGTAGARAGAGVVSEKLWVAVDIGCIECGEESAVLGVFTDEGMAKVVTSEHQSRQSAGWTGQHEFMIFPVDDVNVEHRREYTR